MEEGRIRPSKTHLRRRRRPPEALFFLQPQPQTLLFIILIIFVDSSLASTFSDDLSVMQKLATSISPIGWNSSDPCGDSWPGVSCNGNRVIQISLSGMSLSGTLPTDLNKLTKLTKVYLQNNQLSGSVPSFSGLSSLQELYLSGNAFTSISSDFLSVGLISLQSVRIDDNPFSPWALSDGRLAGATSLNAFSASNASINGSIPDFFGTMPSLQSLRLSYNNLGGSLPSTFSGSSIQNLWLNNQEGPQLSGRIDVLATMTQLIEVWLHVNNFSGPIPDLSNCISIKDLQLRDNSFTGLVPPSLTTSLASLTNVSLSNNNLQGPFPSFSSGVTLDDLGKQNSFCLSKPGPCDPRVTVLLSVAGALGYPSKFADSWTGNNPCPSWLFVTCDSQRNSITVLNFASQQLVGTISPDIANLTALQRLVLSNNNLIGSIPESLTTLPNLVLVDVQNNNLTGKIPAFRSNVVLKTDGNPFLGTDTPATGGDGGSPGSVPGSNATSPTGSESSPGIASTSSFSTGAIVGIVLAAVFICMGCVWICWFRIKKRRQKHGIIQSPDQTQKQQQMGKIGGGSNANGGIFASTSNQHSRTSSGVPEMKVVDGGPNMMISIHELREVTDDFSQDNVLGRGGFGVVYRGEYQDGRKIAVKRMEAGAMGTKGLGEFQAEIAVLTKVRHRHLVALLGYCMEGNERLLVYEYMPQGTLGQHLFDPIENGCSVLTWKQRLTIALDVARGVEYLHSLAHTSFIHRDLKPSNVLLGDSMRAKVSDFGLVKNAPDGKYSVETRLAGTFGYLAPEYCATGRVTTKVDVYAFGVILMELITGRRALEESQPEERRHLVTWFRRVLINKDNIGKVIDPALNVDNEDDQETMSSICAVAELAGHCTAREPYQRPDLGHAVNVLSPLVEQWKPTNREEEDALDLNMNLPQALLRWQANEGSSMTMPTNGFYLGGGSRSLENTQSSLPTKPAGFADSFNSMDCR